MVQERITVSLVKSPDLNDIRIFATAGQEGTLTAAAKRLGLPASTVSRALTRMERDLGVLLARRSSRGLNLTDAGAEYLVTCRRALRTLSEGRDALAGHRDHPKGRLRVVCPVTMAHAIFGPLLGLFLERYPGVRIELEAYASDWNQEPGEDVDVFFKVRSPRDSLRRVRLFPGTARGVFASREYLAAHAAPADPAELLQHRCIGSGVWELRRGSEVARPAVPFAIEASDPQLHLQLALKGLGLVVLPLYMARWPENRRTLQPVLEEWVPQPITLCALFSGPSRLTPKVRALLDFLGESIGTSRDPRLRGLPADGLFTPPTEPGKAGP